MDAQDRAAYGLLQAAYTEKELSEFSQTYSGKSWAEIIMIVDPDLWNDSPESLDE